MVEWLNTRPVVRVATVQFLVGGSAIAGSADRSTLALIILDPDSNPSNHKRLPPPPKKWYPVSGG